MKGSGNVFSLLMMVLSFCIGCLVSFLVDFPSKDYIPSNDFFSASSDEGMYQELARSYKATAVKWRRLAGQSYCASGLGPTGGWCLTKQLVEEQHIPADPGVSRGLVKYLTPLMTNNRPITLVDIGAGVGQYGTWLKQNNVKNITWHGFDGAENVENFTSGFVKWVDVTDPVFDTINIKGDWVLSLEIGEHIPPETTQSFLNTIDRHNRDGIMLSWAIPGQGGFHHINCRSNEEVIGLLADMGYTQDAWTDAFQAEVRETTEAIWFKNSFMVFKRIKRG
ncbi:hypothetical protein SmJEL517_g02671 [Synchytrium microbalum]|uniref:Methyltransferase domain-containing protein n=1 Tax=Synchytrium microbalum TaxID=1806994 RepID=A0A507C0T8_9FUNG|nr:uncharacterized protein SmJEL517_g02671 [Synchytrium microbalum]TPX34707.1 hypothetical protein SmJEL517_g02671 [Synchytrium microbalum]